MKEAEIWEDIVRTKAKERQGTRTDIVATCPQSNMGKTRDIVAEKIGTSGKTYARAKLHI